MNRPLLLLLVTAGLAVVSPAAGQSAQLPSPEVLPALQPRPRADAPAPLSPQRQAVRKVFTAAEPIAMQYKQRMDASVPPGQMVPLPDLHNVVFAAARHGESRIAQRLAMGERIKHYRLVLLVSVVEAYESTGERSFAGKLAVAVAEQIRASDAEYRQTGVWHQLEAALWKLLRDRARVGDVENALAIVRAWPPADQPGMLSAMADGFVEAGDRANAAAIFARWMPAPAAAPPNATGKPIDPNDPSQFAVQRQLWPQDMSAVATLAADKSVMLDYLGDAHPKLLAAVAIHQAERKAAANDIFAAKAELARAMQAIDAGPVAKDPLQKMSDGYSYAAMLRVGRTAMLIGDPKLARDVVNRAGKIATDLKVPDKNAILLDLATTQLVIGDNFGFSNTGYKIKATREMSRSQFEQQARAQAAVETRAIADAVDARKKIPPANTRPATGPATRAAGPSTGPAVAVDKIDAEITAVTRTGTPEQKLAKLIELADGVR